MGIISRSTGGGGSGALTQISDQLLGGAAATIDFPGIASSFNHLLLIFAGRGDAVATTVVATMRYNNDSGTNYDYEQLSAAGAAPAASEGIAQSGFKVGDIAAASAPASVFSQVVCEIAAYKDATGQKTFTSRCSVKSANASGAQFTEVFAGSWRSAVAITRITLSLNSGNYVAASHATLYGLT